MHSYDEEDTRTYTVVVNHEEQYSIWFAGREIPLGWREVGKTGTKAECLAYIEEVWTDMRPLSLRKQMEVVALQQLAEVASSTGTVPRSLGEIVTAGEQLLITPPIAELLSDLPTCALHNQYGSTETHVVSSFTLGGSPDDWPALPPTGQPIANAQIYLLDGNMQPVPVSIAGELYVGGDCLARGYLQRPGLTADRFVPNPFGDAPGMRLYRTGDLARYLPDGNIEFLGRSDHQVKIGDSRGELGEIKAVLAQHPAVKHVAAHAKVGTQGDERLVAYVVLAGEQGIASTDLRNFLRRRLPDYMVPAAFVVLDSLPLTPSGKVNRRALPDPDWSIRELEDVYVAPRTAVEDMLASLLTQILGVKEVGIHDNFFELGGHSLSATRLIARIEDTFQVRIPHRSLFEMPTIAGLAKAIEILRKAFQDPRFAGDDTSGGREEGEL